MKILIYIILGILQGFTEPLPISSSGHLFLFKSIFNTDLASDLNLEIFTNFGSFIAIFIIFFPDIVRLIKSFFSYIFNKDKRNKFQSDFKYCLLIIIGSIPVAIAGVLFKETLENILNNIKILGFTFLITALSLLIVKNKEGNKKDQDITYLDAIIIGIFQMIALCPGISRSGFVLVACLLRGLKRDTALKYTFMLYFPVSIASMGMGILDLLKTNVSNTLLISYLMASICAGIVTYFSYKWLSSLVKKGKLWKFSIYCLILAIFIFIYFR